MPYQGALRGVGQRLQQGVLDGSLVLRHAFVLAQVFAPRSIDEVLQIDAGLRAVLGHAPLQRAVAAARALLLQRQGAYRAALALQARDGAIDDALTAALERWAELESAVQRPA